MTSVQFLVVGYVVSVALLWGYALSLLFVSRSLSRREQSMK